MVSTPADTGDFRPVSAGMWLASWTGGVLCTRSHMPRKIRDLVLAALGVALLVGALGLVDHRVPGQVVGAARDVSAGRWHAPAPVAQLFADISADPILNDGFVIAMVAAGVVLVFLMVRT
jgi:hypothetical protein